MNLVTGALLFQVSSVRGIVKQRMHKYSLYGDVTSWDAKILGELEKLIDRRMQRSRWPVGLESEPRKECSMCRSGHTGTLAKFRT